MLNKNPIMRFNFLSKLSLFVKKNSYKDDLMIVLLAAGLTLYYLSLFFFHPYDQSWLTASYPSESVKNPIGLTGAWLSSIVYYLFGVVSWLLPFPFFLIIYAKFKDPVTNHKYVRLTFSWLGIFISTLFLTIEYQPLVFFNDLPFLVSGSIGKNVHDYLFFILGQTGSWITVITILTASLILALRVRFFSIMIPEALGKISLYLKIITKNFILTIKNIYLRFKLGKNTSSTVNALEISESTAATPKVDFLDSPNNPPAAEPKKPIQMTNRTQLSAVFSQNKINKFMDNHEEISNNKQIIEETLMQFGIQGKIINHHRGPVVTIYEFQPEVGIKQSKLIGLVEDLALALKVESVFVNPVKGERALGIQIPNKEPHIVFLGDLIQSAKYKSAQDSLTLTLGIADSGEIICENLATMPHLLIAGATGTGKSININAIICSLIIKLTPEKLRLIMIDPKVLELSIYNGIPHLLLPVITEARKANHALRWAIHEMEKRYEIMQSFNVRSIESYNQILQQDTNKSQTDKEAPEFEPFPYIAIIIDELADLMLTSPKETEILIQRLAQKARASGIHMILATQRPSVDVITGVIKANLPCRISFQVTSRHDSRTILDQIGAEKLLGKGDMFFLKPGQQRLKRIQGPYITDGEIADLVDLLKSKDQDYDQEVINWIEKEIDNKDEQQIGSSNIQIIDDTKYKEALEVAEKHGIVSASFLQRHLQIGYNRAARMIDYMEKEKIISKANGSKPRKWLGQKIES